MPSEFTPLTELEPDSWHRRTHPNPVAQALAHSSSFRLPFRSIRRSDFFLKFLVRSLRDGSGHTITVPPLPGRDPWNRQYAEQDFPTCPRRPLPEVPTPKSGA